MCKALPLPCDELCRLYEEEQQTTITLSHRYGCSITTVANRLRRCGVTLRDGRFKTKVVPRDELLRLYVIEQWPINRIARHFGISVGTLYNRLDAADVPRRTAKLLLRELSVGYTVAGHHQAAQRPRLRLRPRVVAHLSGAVY